MIKVTRRQTAMLGEARSRSHWLELSADVRTFLDSIPVEKWPTVLAKSKLSISVARVAREREACLQVRTLMEETRAERKKVGFGPLVKGFIVSCAAAAGVRNVAHYFGIYDSQVCTWRQAVPSVDASVVLRELSAERRAPSLKTADDSTVPPAAQPVVPITVQTNIPDEHQCDTPSGYTRKSNEEAFSKLQEAFKRFGAKTKRRYSRSEKRAILALTDEFGSKEVHERLGVSYDTIARIVRRAGRKTPEEAGEIPARYGLVVELMKKHPGMGPMQIRDWIARHHGQRMGVNTVREVMERAGWVPPLVRKKEFRPGQFRRYEAVRRNVLWHADFLHVYINTAKVYILLIQDDHSRFIVGAGFFEGEQAGAVLSLVSAAIEKHGKPECFMADRGSAFRSWRGIGQLTRYLEEIGIDQHVAVEARVNGKLENLNQQVQKELLDVRRFTSLAEFESAFAAWVEFFNFSRCHQGLAKLQVPADRFFPGAMDAYTKSMNKHRREGEMLRVLQEFILATQGQPAAQVDSR